MKISKKIFSKISFLTLLGLGIAMATQPRVPAPCAEDYFPQDSVDYMLKTHIPNFDSAKINKTFEFVDTTGKFTDHTLAFPPFVWVDLTTRNLPEIISISQSCPMTSIAVMSVNGPTPGIYTFKLIATSKYGKDSIDVKVTLVGGSGIVKNKKSAEKTLSFIPTQAKNFEIEKCQCLINGTLPKNTIKINR